MLSAVHDACDTEHDVVSHYACATCLHAKLDVLM